MAFNQFKGHNPSDSYSGQVKKSQVVDASKSLAEEEEKVFRIGQMNRPADPEKRVEAAAEYRIAQDKLARANTSYNSLFDAWARGGYQE